MRSSLYVVLAAAIAGLCVAVVLAQDLAEIPADLAFSCQGRRYGYYADVEANCQVFHICMGQDQGEASDGKFSFLCPNQTLFNQVSVCALLLVVKLIDTQLCLLVV
jgi:hypothetical protein